MARAQIVEVQALRACAAILVAFSHIHHEFLERVTGLPISFGGFGVDLFFVISGFIMVYAASPLFEQRGASVHFFLKRLARITPIYWMATAIFVLYVLDTQPFSQAGISWTNIFASLFYLPVPRPNGHMGPTFSVGWTLNYEMFFYLIFAFGLLLRRRVALVLISAFLLIFVLLAKYYQSRWNASIIFLARPIVIEFVLGMWLAVVYQRGFRLPRWAAGAAIATGMALVWYFTVNNAWIRDWRGISWGFAALLVLAGFALHDWSFRGRLRRTALALGDASYAIYLVHPLVMLAIRETVGRIWAHYHIIVPVQNWPSALAMLLTSIGLGILIFRRIELPITSALYRLINTHFPVGPRPPLTPLQQAVNLHAALIRLGWRPPER